MKIQIAVLSFSICPKQLGILECSILFKYMAAAPIYYPNQESTDTVDTALVPAPAPVPVPVCPSTQESIDTAGVMWLLDVMEKLQQKSPSLTELIFLGSEYDPIDRLGPEELDLISTLFSCYEDEKLHIQKVNLSGNSIGDYALSRFVKELLEKSPIKELTLTNVGITDKFIKYAFSSFLNNVTLVHLNICGNEISIDGLNMLVKIIRRKKNLTVRMPGGELIQYRQNFTISISGQLIHPDHATLGSPQITIIPPFASTSQEC